MRQLAFVHARAVVGNVDVPMVFVAGEADVDFAAFGAVGHGITQYVVESAVEVALVGGNGGIGIGRGVGKIDLLIVLHGDGAAVFH